MDYSNNYAAWDYTDEDIAQRFLFFNVLKDGRIHVLAPQGPDNMKIPPFDDPSTGVKIKDLKISQDVSVRIFLPPSPSGKLPVLLYAHGGGFCMNSAFSVEYTRLLTNYVGQFNIIAISVEYGIFPSHPMPACYDDSWFALQWVASHSSGSGNVKMGPEEPWISEYADLKRIFVAGDSAGGNICHTVLANVGKMGLPGEAKVKGMILVHPYFGEDDKMWMYMCPTNGGPQDRRMKPAVEDLARLGCERVLVFVAEKDELRDAGVKYVEELRKSEWNGTVEIVEHKDKDHCFHISKYLDPEAIAINRQINSFIHYPQADQV